MIRKNFLLFIRNIQRDKTSFTINLIGLSTGLACALLIYLWVNHELDVDKFHEKDNRLYQVMLNTNSPDGIMTSESTPGPLAKSLVEEIPEIEYAVSVVPVCWKNKVGVLSVGDNNIAFCITSAETDNNCGLYLPKLASILTLLL